MIGIFSAKNPLSRASGKRKLLVAVPMAVVSGLAVAIGLGPIAQMFLIGLTAYAIVGLLEVLIGASLVNAAKQWDSLAGWQRGLIATAIIAASCGLAFVVIPLIA